MSLLLDTHILLWWLNDSGRLSAGQWLRFPTPSTATRRTGLFWQPVLGPLGNGPARNRRCWCPTFRSGKWRCCTAWTLRPEPTVDQAGAPPLREWLSKAAGEAVRWFGGIISPGAATERVAERAAAGSEAGHLSGHCDGSGCASRLLPPPGFMPRATRRGPGLFWQPPGFWARRC